ncbi:hypothetical protein M758_7G066200 [Ceratodon purpureus]|nr:hypothetical protein M758_7G066200 [Ceratodon purpureus]
MSSPGHSAVSGQNLIKLLNRVRLALGIALGIIALILVIYVACVFWRHLSAFLSRWRTASLVRWHGPQKTGTKVHLVVKNLTMVPLPYTFEEIMDATENPNDAYIIGRGAHGVVYKVALSSRTPIAVKKIEPLDITPALVHKSFRREIETVGKVKHRNLATLLGFMQWGKVGLLLYDYVCNGNLHSALHNREQAREIDLNWKVRLHIAEGVARGLACLHHDHNPPIVHRDIKSSNVLLDDDLKACISDFGLAKVLAISQVEYNQWLTTANVLGTFGYIAPGKSCLVFAIHCYILLSMEVTIFQILLLLCIEYMNLLF